MTATAPDEDLRRLGALVRYAKRVFLASLAFAVPLSLVLWTSPPPTLSPPASVSVRWAQEVNDNERRDAEQALGLEDGDVREGRTWVYSLSSANRRSLRRIVEHRYIEDTHGIDRREFILSERDMPESKPVLVRAFALSVAAGLLLCSLRVLLRQLRVASASIVSLLRRHRRIAAGTALTLMLSSVFAASFERPEMPVRVRWSAGLDEAALAEAERTHRLVASEHEGGTSWSYRMRITSRRALLDLVNDPRVEDTHGFARAAPQLSPEVRRSVWQRRSRIAIQALLIAAVLAMPLSWLARAPRVARTVAGALHARRVQVLIVAMFVFTLVLRFNSFQPTNDHMYHVALAQQALAGDVPYRDYVDLGQPLQILLSAGAQGITNSLVGEALLTAMMTALAHAGVLALAASLSGSATFATAVAFLSVSLNPRLYGYPKLLVYVVLAGLIASYIRHPSSRLLAGMGAWVGVAFLFRHDHAAYAMVGAFAAIATVHRADGIRQTLRSGALCAAVAAAVSAPFVLFVQSQIGLVEYVSTGLSFTRAENANSRILFPAPETGAQLWSAFDSANVWVLLYYLYWILPVVCIVIAGRTLWRQRGPSHQDSSDSPAAIAFVLAILCLAVNYGLLRSHENHRVADAVILPAILTSWLYHHVSAHGSGNHRRRWLRRLAVVLPLSMIASALVRPTWLHLQEAGIASGRPASVWNVARNAIRRNSVVPHYEVLAPESPRRLAASYIHRCTAPRARILVTWFAPELYYYSHRRFAGGQLLLYNSVLTGTAAQLEMIDRFDAESVPVVLTHADSSLPFYALVADYMTDRYRLAGTVGEGRQEIAVLVDSRLPVIRLDPATGWPCYQ